MMTVTIPGNLNLLYAGLISAATFDVIPFIDEIHDLLWNFEHSIDEIENTGFNSIGFETNNFIINSGSLFIMFLIFLVQLIMIKILKSYAEVDQSYIMLYRKFKFKHDLRQILSRVVMEGYLEFLCAGIL